MKSPNKSHLVQKAKQLLLKRMLSDSSDRLSPSGTPADPVDFALWSIERHAEAKATRMIISGKTKKLLPEIDQLNGHLRELEISHTEISDLSPLGGLPSLESLKINATKVADWSVLSSLTSLRRLALSFCGSSDLPSLSACEDLRQLSISTDQLIDDTLSGSLPAPPRLETLGLYGRAVNSLSGLEGCRDLRSLHCIRTTIGSLEPLRGMAQLKQVYVPGSNVSDLSVLATLPCFLGEHPDIKLDIRDTLAVERYPELARTLRGTALHQYEYGQHKTAIKAVRAVTRSA